MGNLLPRPLSHVLAGTEVPPGREIPKSGGRACELAGIQASAKARLSRIMGRLSGASLLLAGLYSTEKSILPKVSSKPALASFTTLASVTPSDFALLANSTELSNFLTCEVSVHS